MTEDLRTCEIEDGGCGESFFGGHVCRKEPKNDGKFKVKSGVRMCLEQGCTPGSWVKKDALTWVMPCQSCGREMSLQTKAKKKNGRG